VTTNRKEASRTVKREAKPASSYHHGNLEQALVNLATELIAKQGVESLTLRLLGEQLGVSRTALYRHFSDKQTLLVRVAEEGFAQFGDSLEAARTSTDRTDVFVRMAHAYFTFAQKNPGQYRVMFDASVLKKAHTAKLHAAAKRSFASLFDEVVRDSAKLRGSSPGSIGARSLGLWSLLHGYSMLAINGQFDDNRATVTKAMVASVEALVKGQRTEG
jgi:AcrR family transcriptional regulator